MKRLTLTVDLDEHATILAALRTYQEARYGNPANRPDRIHDIATRCDALVSLDDSAIDSLCERINFAEEAQA